jgi:1A family penicillin-binding protein
MITKKPSKEKLPEPKKRSLFFFLAKLFVSGFLLAIVFAVGVFIYYSRELPSSGQLSQRKMAESTKIFDRTGEVLLYEIHGEEKRTVIPFNRMPLFIKNTTIVAEDDQFYNHHGLDFKAILRAILADLKHSKSQGASTITQQLIKNSVLSSEKTYTRKVKEAILSLELERRFSKDQILEMYLNEIPYGSNAYGIEAAAQTFFGKPAIELSLDESAVLAALPKAPTFYSPYGNNIERLLWRKEWIIKRMEDLGYIKQSEAVEALKIDTISKIKPFATLIKAPHFVIYVKQKLVDEYGEGFIESGGLKIYTSLDWKLQIAAEEAIKQQAERNKKDFGATNAAMVVIDPKNGEVLAMVGSVDYFDKENNGNVNVALRPRQPGSSFKPFAYAAAFIKGYLPKTILFDVKTDFEDRPGVKYSPQNYSGKFIGPISMKSALAMSLNVPAVKTLYLSGINETIDLAESMGIKTLKDRSRYGLALVLGGGEVTLKEETQAFSVFANDGLKQEEKSILKIENSEGGLVKENISPGGKRVLNSQIARQINDCLSDNSARAPVFGRNNPLYISGKNTAGKTGTTQEFRDAWTVGYTPQIAVGVWVGNNNNLPMKQGADGSVVAAPIWRNFMDRFINDYSKEDFIRPEEEDVNKPMIGGFLEKEVELRIDKKSGYLASETCSSKNTKKKTFRESHSILFYIDKDDPRGPYPKEPKNDPQFKSWEDGVKKWAEENNIDPSPPEKTGCKGKEEN